MKLSNITDHARRIDGFDVKPKKKRKQHDKVENGFVPPKINQAEIEICIHCPYPNCPYGECDLVGGGKNPFKRRKYRG